MNFVMAGRAIQMPNVMTISEFNPYGFYFFVCFELVRLAISWLLEKLVIVLEICAQMMNFVIMKFVIQVITTNRIATKSPSKFSHKAIFSKCSNLTHFWDFQIFKTNFFVIFGFPSKQFFF